MLNLVLGQPLEVLQSQLVVREISLAGHDAALHEERLLAGEFLARLILPRGLEYVRVMANGMVADEPGVHVDAGGLLECPFRGLATINLSARASPNQNGVGKFLF